MRLAAGIRKLPEWLDGDPIAVDDEIAHWGKVPLGSAHQLEKCYGIASFAIPSALYAYLLALEDPEQVPSTAITVGGDVDTVAAMAGAMVGAAVGLGGLTARLSRWAQRLNDQGAYRFDDLVKIARAV